MRRLNEKMRVIDRTADLACSVNSRQHTRINHYRTAKHQFDRQSLLGMSVGVATVASVPAGGWRSKTGVLAAIPVGAGEIVWIAPLPGDFDPGKRPDLVFPRVNTERLYTIVLGNLGVRTGSPWPSYLGARATKASESAFYTDKRVPRDDPYADMRW